MFAESGGATFSKKRNKRQEISSDSRPESANTANLAVFAESGGATFLKKRS